MNVLDFNEYQRLKFFTVYPKTGALREEQIATMGPEEVELVLDLAMKLKWAAMERKNMIDCCDESILEVFREFENKLVPIEEFVLENCTPEELKTAQEGIWYKVMRLVEERKLTNALDIVQLYDSVNKPYFRLGWVDAWLMKEDQVQILED